MSSEMAQPQPVPVNFELNQDQFPHAWFFNRFRIDALGQCTMVTFGLVTEADGTLAANAVVLSANDLVNNRDRALHFLTEVDAPLSSDTSFNLRFSNPPARVYPVNFFNLSRVDQVGEIGLFRFSLSTLAGQIDEARKGGSGKNPTVKCYPVVMFRCDVSVQVAFVRQLYTR